MKVHIIQIGNSKGLRLPKAVLQQYGLEDEVELETRADEIVIKAIHQPRHDWDLAFQEMSAHQDDALLDLNVATKWDGAEWEW